MSRYLDILRLSLPLIAAQCAQSLMLVTDTLLFGLLGVDALAGGGLGAGIFQFFFIVLTGLFVPVAVETAIHSGRGDPRPVAGLLKAALVIALTLSVALGVLLWWLPEMLKTYFPESAAQAYARNYLQASVLIPLPATLFMLVRGLASGLGVTAPIMPVSIFMAIVNIPISYVLMQGLGPLNGMGVSGVAVGTALSLSLGASLLTWRLYGHPQVASILREAVRARGRRADFGPFWRQGLPVAGSHGLEAGVFTAATLMAGTLGVIPLAAHNIALQSAVISFNLYMGIAQGHAIRVGQHFGAGRLDECRRTAIAGSVLGLGAAALACAVFLGMPELLIQLFTLGEERALDASVLDYGVGILAIAAAFQAVDGAQVIAMAALRAVRMGIEPTVIALVGYWLVAFPLALWLMPGFGLAGIWVGLGLGLGVTALALLTLFHYRLRSLRRSFSEMPSSPSG